jgi:hypothetical protein
MSFPSSFWALPLIALVAGGGVGCTPSIGDKCTLSTDCSTLGDRLCDTTQPGGYCTIFNCEPDQCPSSICVAFAPTLDPACGAADNGVSPRFEQSFCMAPCSSNSNCRGEYECIDLQTPANQILRHAEVVDLGAGDGGLGFSVCMAATCGDGIKDAAETDVDCGGGTCVACADKHHCLTGSDCISGTCSKGTCVAPGCTNSEADAGATGSLFSCSGPNCEQCGGASCAACVSGGLCQQNSDCTSNICESQLAGGVCPPGTPPGTTCCQPGDCTDGVQDGVETDVDCGGGVPCPPNAGVCAPTGCPPCTTGLKCMQDTDCVSNSCIGGFCGAPAICFPSDAGFDGSAPWTPFSLDAGDDGGDAGDGG